MANDKKGVSRVGLLAQVLEAVKRAIGFGTAQAVTRVDKSKTSRALQQLVETGSVARARIVGSTRHVWGSPPEFIRAVSKSTNGTWSPPPEFRHDELALQVAYGLASPNGVMTEAQLEKVWPSSGRKPDALVLLPNSELAAIEVELSKKTGRTNGFQMLAAAMASRIRGEKDNAPELEQFLAGDDEVRKVVQTVLVAPFGYAKSIARRFNQILGQDEKWRGRWWGYVAVMENGDIDPCVRRWYVGREDFPMEGTGMHVWMPRVDNGDDDE